MKKLIINIETCEDCPYYEEICVGDGTVNRLCCHRDLEDPIDIPEGFNMSTNYKCPINPDTKIMDLIIDFWNLFPDEFDQVLRDNDMIHLDEAHEVVADNHDPYW